MRRDEGDTVGVSKRLTMIPLCGCVMLLLALVSGCASPTLRYDGVYMVPSTFWGDDVPSWGYLRFYPDGRVVSVTSTGRPEQIISRGVAIVRGGNISFSVFSRRGSVEYAGKLRKDGRLRLDIHSNINGYRHTREYTFIPWQRDLNDASSEPERRLL